jgi:serpin B
VTSVIHKTFIEVAEKGTRAGAVTVIANGAESAGPPEEIFEIYLDRPFVYMLIDCENNIPFFIGTLMNPEG